MAQPMNPLTSPLSHIYKPFSFKLAMALLLSFALVFLLLFFTISSASRRHSPRNDVASDYIINETCKASRDPPTRRSSLSQLPPPSSVVQVIQSTLGLSTDNLSTGRRMVHEILAASAANQNRSTAANTCLEVLDYSEYRMRLTADAVPRGRLKDARSWMSAALAYQYGCWSGLKYVNGTSLVDRTKDFFNSSLIRSSSDALSMMVNYDVFGNQTGEWGPAKTERDGFWEPGSAPSGSTPSVIKLKPNVTVCKGGGWCDYETVQGAVNAAPAENGKRFVIWIKAGVYDEIVRIPLEKKNVVFVGDGMGKTVITGSFNVGLMGVPTYNSATVGVVGDGFMATGLTIQNTAGPGAHQAVAFRSDSDLSVVENCEFLGNQDTLYAHALRQYYKSCRIQGNVDFIFGNSAAFFQDCIILVASRQSRPEEGESNTVTAHGRIDPAQSTGFVFQNCVVNGTDAYMALYYSQPGVHKNYLGRPWKEYSRTVFVNCTLEALISVQGWMPWNGDFALKSLYFGEFENRGLGSDTSRRVSWSSQIMADHVYAYSVQNFIQGHEWIATLS